MGQTFRQFNSRFGFPLLSPALVVGSYFLGAKAVFGELPGCVDCTCKMVYAWDIGNNKASGMKTRLRNGITSPEPIQIGRPVQAINCPDPPKPCFRILRVDRYEYTNPSWFCNDNPNSRLPREADVHSLGSRVATDVHYSDCIPEGQNCPPTDE